MATNTRVATKLTTFQAFAESFARHASGRRTTKSMRWSDLVRDVLTVMVLLLAIATAMLVC
jgi:hypothetical protein